MDGHHEAIAATSAIATALQRVRDAEDVCGEQHKATYRAVRIMLTKAMDDAYAVVNAIYADKYRSEG